MNAHKPYVTDAFHISHSSCWPSAPLLMRPATHERRVLAKPSVCGATDSVPSSACVVCANAPLLFVLNYGRRLCIQTAMHRRLTHVKT